MGSAEGLRKLKAESIELGALISYERPQPNTQAYDQLLLKAPVGEVLQ